MEKLLSRLSALVLALVLTGSFVAVPSPARADDTLTILGSSIAPSLYDVLDIVANGVGFYKQEHLNVVEQLVNSPSAAAQLVATGKGDLCSLSYEAVLQGYQKGLKLQIFLTRAARFSNVMAVLDDSPIRTLSDFKGKNIGVINIGSAGEVASQMMLAGAGVGKNDVTYSPIGQGPQAIDAVVNHRVDGVGYPYGEVVPIEVVANVKMRVFRAPMFNDISNAGFATTPATLAARSDVLGRFSRAIVKSAIFIRYNPAAAARFFLAASGSKFTEQDVKNKTQELIMLKDDLPAADALDKRIGALDLAGLQVYSRLLNDYGMTTSVVPVSAIASNALVATANDFDHRAVIAFAKSYHAPQ